MFDHLGRQYGEDQSADGAAEEDRADGPAPFLDEPTGRHSAGPDGSGGVEYHPGGGKGQIEGEGHSGPGQGRHRQPQHQHAGHQHGAHTVAVDSPSDGRRQNQCGQRSGADSPADQSAAPAKLLRQGKNEDGERGDVGRHASEYCSARCPNHDPSVIEGQEIF